MKNDNPTANFRDELMRKFRTRFPDGLPEKKLPEREPDYRCSDCKDTGYFSLDVSPDHPEYGKVQFCHCKRQEIKMRRTMKRRKDLEQIDGLTVAERKMTFDSLYVGENNRQLGQVIEYLRYAIDEQAGLVTMTGESGIAKSALMAAVVNECREREIESIYISMVDLLDELRKGFNPDSNINFDQRWDLLRNVDVLCIDEIDKFNSKPWAQERFDAPGQ